MDIVFLTLGYSKDINTRGIYTDLMSSFVKMGHKVTVFRQDETGDLKTQQSQTGVTVVPVFTGKVTKTSFIKKGINLLLLEQRFYKAVNDYCKEHIDLLLYSTPPITFCGAIKKLKKKHNCINYLLLKDIFPQNAVDLKMFPKKSPLYTLFRNKEKKLYKYSDLIGCMSPANVRYVLVNNPWEKKDKVHVSPNCIVPKKSEAVKTSQTEHTGLNLIYGGNLGKPQGISFIIECCKVIEKYNDVTFTIIGSGTEYSKLENAVKEYNLKNTKLLPFMPKPEYVKYMENQDLGMVFLDNSFTIPNFPSRILDYLDNGLPIFACTDIVSDVRQEICDEGAGFWSQSNDIKSFEEIIQKLISDKSILSPMKEKACQLLEKKYNAEMEAKNICKRVSLIRK